MNAVAHFLSRWYKVQFKEIFSEFCSQSKEFDISSTTIYIFSPINSYVVNTIHFSADEISFGFMRNLNLFQRLF